MNISEYAMPNIFWATSRELKIFLLSAFPLTLGLELRFLIKTCYKEVRLIAVWNEETDLKHYASIKIDIHCKYTV